MELLTQFDSTFLKHFFNNSSTCVIVTNSLTGEPIELVSPNINHLLAYTPEELENKKVLFDDLIHDDDIANYLVESQHGSFQTINKKSSQKGAQDFGHSEYRLLHADGHYVWVKDTVQLVVQDGKVKQLVHILTDMSHEMYLKENILTQKERILSILHVAGLGLWEWYTNEDYMTCDENWSHLIGFVDAVPNMKLSRLLALVHPDELTSFRQMLEDLKTNNQKTAQVTARVRHLSGGWRYHLCNASIREDDDGNRIVTVAHNDITEQKENELGAIAALSTRNQFFARVSHEIRTPLHGILGMLSLVKKDIVNEQASEKIEKIVANSEQLLYLLNDILDLAKLNEAKLKISLELTSITEVIRQVERLFSFKANEKSIALKTTLPSLRNDMVMTDKVRITQVLSNLVSNAIKYTHRGSVHIFTKMDNEKLILCVEDTGIGIKNTAEIFDAYQQEDAGQAQGNNSTGLGLDIVRKLCDLLGVDINLLSGRSGTLFELSLGKPMPNSIVVSQNVKADQNTNIDLNKLMVLVVDDSDINREIVIEMLAGYGANCLQASDGYEAVKMSNNDNKFDIILMDKHMPNMNGLDATHQIRQNTSLERQPIIIGLTADAFDSDSEVWVENGLDELITKPFDIELLIRTIKRCLNRSRIQS